MGVHVVVVYAPKPGSEAALEKEIADHVPTLRRLELATDNPSLALRAPDGAIVEVFEWVSRDAMESAHDQPEVKAMWERFEACCTYARLVDLPNAGELFAEFEAVGRF